MSNYGRYVSCVHAVNTNRPNDTEHGKQYLIVHIICIGFSRHSSILLEIGEEMNHKKTHTHTHIHSTK